MVCSVCFSGIVKSFTNLNEFGLMNTSKTAKNRVYKTKKKHIYALMQRKILQMSTVKSI